MLHPDALQAHACQHTEVPNRSMTSAWHTLIRFCLLWLFCRISCRGASLCCDDCVWSCHSSLCGQALFKKAMRTTSTAITKKTDQCWKAFLHKRDSIDSESLFPLDSFARCDLFMYRLAVSQPGSPHCGSFRQAAFAGLSWFSSRPRAKSSLRNFW